MAIYVNSRCFLPTSHLILTCLNNDIHRQFDIHASAMQTSYLFGRSQFTRYQQDCFGSFERSSLAKHHRIGRGRGLFSGMIADSK